MSAQLDSLFRNHWMYLLGHVTRALLLCVCGTMYRLTYKLTTGQQLWTIQMASENIADHSDHSADCC